MRVEILRLAANHIDLKSRGIDCGIELPFFDGKRGVDAPQHPEKGGLHQPHLRHKTDPLVGVPKQVDVSSCQRFGLKSGTGSRFVGVQGVRADRQKVLGNPCVVELAQ